MFSPEMLAQLQALGGMQGMLGLGDMPQVALGALQQSPHMYGPPGMGGTLAGGKPFPVDAAVLAALGAAGMGLRGGQQRGPAPSGGLPVASAPGRGLPMQQFALPRR